MEVAVFLISQCGDIDHLDAPDIVVSSGVFMPDFGQKTATRRTHGEYTYDPHVSFEHATPEVAARHLASW